MASCARDRIESSFGGKLGMVQEGKRDHRFWVLYVNGEWVCQTKISTGTGYRDYPDHLLAKMAKSLKVSRAQLNGFIDCPIDRDGWIQILRETGQL